MFHNRIQKHFEDRITAPAEVRTLFAAGPVAPSKFVPGQFYTPAEILALAYQQALELVIARRRRRAAFSAN